MMKRNYCSCIIVICLVCIPYLYAVPTVRTNEQPPVHADILFEGDIIASKEDILSRFNFSSIPHGDKVLQELVDSEKAKNSSVIHDIPDRYRRETVRDSSRLWPGGVVPYIISSDFSQRDTQIIEDAIDHWQGNTCLRFNVRQNQWDYVEFVVGPDGVCNSYVGRICGHQIINLGRGCVRRGIVIHEIGHAVGFWHEQSRPDRDNYVTIHFNNIPNALEHNFMKLQEDESDSLGSTYDYGSIMHYSEWLYFSGFPAFLGISINNRVEYERQESPTLGQREALSGEDINQANILYFCPGTGIRGFLIFHIRYGQSLEDTDPIFNAPDPYVKLTIADSRGNRHYRRSSTKHGTRNPLWNQWVYTSERNWIFFKIQVWDADGFLTFADDEMTLSETFEVESGQHTNIRHCENLACNGRIFFDYKIIPPESLRRGRLNVQIRHASNLLDTDPIGNNPDPYVRIKAVKSTGQLVTQVSRTVSGTTNPTWNQLLSFSCADWIDFTVQVWDDDNNADDPLSNEERIVLFEGPTSDSSRRHTALQGSLIFDYDLILDANECSPNPCLNGGTCIDRHCGYYCLCRSGYHGTNCERLRVRGHLKVKARYARNLRDTDGWWNNPDPYVRVRAVHTTGSYTRNTRRISETRNPTWNEWENFDFGSTCPTWDKFELQIWDADRGSDDALSSKESMFFQQTGYFSSQRHNAHGNGYMIYDFQLIRDGTECYTYACQNGGTCIEECCGYRCSCRSGYTGSRCQYRTGRMRVYARYGRNLPDRDGWLNRSDPYIEFIAIDQFGDSVRLTTSVRRGTHNPNWNQPFDFGTRSWRHLKVRVYDSDRGSDDPLSSRYEVQFGSPGHSRTWVRHNCYSGYIYFDYSYI